MLKKLFKIFFIKKENDNHIPTNQNEIAHDFYNALE